MSRWISQFSSVAQSCQTLCNPMNHSTPGLHHQLPEFTQTHVHWVSDAIQPSHPLWSASPPALNLSQHQFSSVQLLSHVRLFATPLTAACQASLSITNSQSLSKLMSIGISDAIQPSYPLLTPSPPAFNLSQHQCLFQWVSSSHQVAQVLELQHQPFQWILRTDLLKEWLVWSPCSPRDSQESSPTPQFKSINSSALSLLYGSTLTSIHDYWKNYSFH